MALISAAAPALLARLGSAWAPAAAARLMIDSGRGYATDSSPASPPLSGDPTAATGSSDPLTAKIKSEHARLEELFQQYEQAGVDAATKMRLGWEIIRGLSVHAAKEEMTLYPTVAKTMGDRAADSLVEEHQTLKNTLYELDSINDPNSPRIDELMRKTIEVTRHHVKEEEGSYLPRLAEKVGREGMERLARSFEAARLAAPTRPHPAAPNRPPLNIPANASAVPVDLARDAARFGPGNVTGDVEEHRT